jgi:hypothetical protein
MGEGGKRRRKHGVAAGEQLRYERGSEGCAGWKPRLGQGSLFDMGFLNSPSGDMGNLPYGLGEVGGSVPSLDFYRPWQLLAGNKLLTTPDMGKS